MNAPLPKPGFAAQRSLDVLLSGTGLLLLAPLLALLWLAGRFDTGSPLFRQQRVGRRQKPFVLIKFRTMRPDTASVGTHQVNPAAITPYGRFLRRSKLDELPQLWNVLKGDMSLVGPRPCLPNQTELVQERERRGVFAARPGITGMAQVQGVDMSEPARLAELDALMLDKISLGLYLRLLLMTVTGSGSGDRVRTP
ncbi:MAG: sugar transferase [Serpentinimonas sp.]|nr:sugar transferase [Serpentinimonas sp.]